MDTILRAADIFHAATGSYPGSVREMVDGVAKDKDGEPINSLEKFPLDPWGREYRYEILGGRPQVTCLGRDGVEGGEGENDDLVRPGPEEDEHR